MSADAWLQAVGAPLPDLPCGEDPRYWDEFALLKGEIEKLQGTDFSRVWEVGRELLVTRTKDLRIAGYLVPAGLFTGGIPRMLEAVRGYRLLLDLFWEGCHPRQEGARAAALRWLNQGKMESFARRFGAEAPPAEVEALEGEIETFNALLRRRMGEDAPVWTVLKGWFRETLRSPAPAPPAAEAAPEPQAAAPPAPPAAHPGGSGGFAVASEREVAAATRAVRDYLRGEGEELRGAFFARALRWGGLISPPHEGGKTRVAPPRPSGWGEIERARGAGDWETVLRGCEGLFLEPGGQFDLDLQASAAEAARALGRCDLAEFIAGQAALLARRFPELPRLAFEDGRPFASPATRQWLQEREGGKESAPEEEGWERTFAGRLEGAREALRRKRLHEGLALLGSCPAAREKERFRLRLAQARLCLEGGRPEVALPLLEELHAAVVRSSLHLWEEALALEVWTALLEACRSLEREGREELGKLASEVRGLICRTDPGAAVGLL